MSFSQIYVINLKKRYDKNLLMKIKLDLIGIKDYTVFEGIDGKSESLEEICNKINVYGKFKSRGAIGLILTYIELLNDIYLKGYDNVLILEDDVNCHKSYLKLISLLSSILNDKQYDIIWLGANQTKMTKAQFNDVKNKSTYKPDPTNAVYTYGTFSIILNKTGVIKMMERINMNNIKNLKPIDVMLNDMIQDGVLNGIVCYPFLFMPDVTESDNMKPRIQEKFALERGFRMNDYNYISNQEFRQLLFDLENSEANKKTEQIVDNIQIKDIDIINIINISNKAFEELKKQIKQKFEMS